MNLLSQIINKLEELIYTHKVVLVHYFAYAIGLVGLIFLLISLGFTSKQLKARYRLTRDSRRKNFSSTWIRYPILEKYHHLLSSTIKQYEQRLFSTILTYQGLIFVFLFSVISLLTQSLLFGLCSSLFFVLVVPITILWVRHKRIQNQLQESLHESITLLLTSYRTNHFNMLYALKDVSEQVEGQLKMVFGKLFARMHDSDDIKVLASKTFAFQLGNYRGKNLATAILRAIKDGTNVETILVDMKDDIHEFRKAIRDAMTESRETAMLGFLPLPGTAVLIYVTATYLLPDGNGYHYIFGTALGLKVFLASVIIGFINLLLALILRRPKQGI